MKPACIMEWNRPWQEYEQPTGFVKERRSVKEVLRKCGICKQYQGRPMCAPASPDLPQSRIDHSGFAFQATGLDFAGPLFMKESSGTVKAYILLLTCATSRAVHLELVYSMSSDGFLRGFRRFVARRGVPDLIINDNFKTFKSSKVKRFMSCQGIKQQFILPASPWWGGFYERPHAVSKVLLDRLPLQFFAICLESKQIKHLPFSAICLSETGDWKPYYILMGNVPAHYSINMVLYQFD